MSLNKRSAIVDGLIVIVDGLIAILNSESLMEINKLHYLVALHCRVNEEVRKYIRTCLFYLCRVSVVLSFVLYFNI